MSIYCSIFGIGEEHKESCARISPMKGYGGKVFRQDGSKPCTCGSCPIRYQHSAVLPSDKDKRDGGLGIAAIPSHITRDGRDDKPEGGKWYPWLRVSLYAENDDTVILTRKQVIELRDALHQWLDRSTRISDKAKHRKRIKRSE